MTRDKPSTKSDGQATREARLAEQLRANLKRRKEQARARKQGEPAKKDPQS